MYVCMTERGKGKEKERKRRKRKQVPADSVVGESQPYSDFLSLLRSAIGCDTVLFVVEGCAWGRAIDQAEGVVGQWFRMCGDTVQHRRDWGEQ